MSDERAFLDAIAADPGDWQVRLILADYLQDNDDSRAEMIRLTYDLTRSTTLRGRTARESRYRELLAEGVRAPAPVGTNSMGMTFAAVPPGEFLMGSGPRESGRKNDEAQHRVILTKPYWIGTHLIDQTAWLELMHENPSSVRDDPRLPVDSTNWVECVEFCRRLSERDQRSYRLPSEAEWEYACRAGTTTPFHFGRRIGPTQVNYDGNYSYLRSPKGEYRCRQNRCGELPANPWGIYDMHGNLWEWVSDNFANFQGTEATDPRGPRRGNLRVLRGGCWDAIPGYCRSAIRNDEPPTSRSRYYGCRIALDRF